MKKAFILILCLTILSGVFAQNNNRRLALVIGNAAYPNKPLANPVNDADLMAETLRKLDFTVIKKTNLTKPEMDAAILNFCNRLDSYGVALFYYAGHGVQVKNKNYLIPIDAKLKKPATVELEAYDLSKITGQFEFYPDNLNLMFVDACRNNPFRSWARDINGSGFAKMEPASGTIISFATAAGATAADGTGDNGTYTEQLVKQMMMPQKIEDVLKNTLKAVNDVTGGQQMPDTWSRYTGDFYFVAPKRTGTLVIGFTQYAGTVKIDNKPYSTVAENSTKTISSLPTGTYTLSIGNQWSQRITIRYNKITTVTALKQKIHTTPSDHNSNDQGSKPNDLPRNMVFVEGGTFKMGSTDGADDEKPVHTVTLDDFYISRYEVTHAEYIKFMNDIGVNSNGSHNGKEYVDMDDEDCAVDYRNGSFYFKGSSDADSEDCPMIEVTWYGAKAYCEWAGGRLPTEAEWEYAARGGSVEPRRGVALQYAGSNTIDEVAWYYGNSDSKTHPVGQKKPNELGLYDMSGNVWEWCNDWYGENYYSESKNSTNPTGPSSGTSRVSRGGSWLDYAAYCRSAIRNYWGPGSGDFLGFRLVVVP